MLQCVNSVSEGNTTICSKASKKHADKKPKRNKRKEKVHFTPLTLSASPPKQNLGSIYFPKLFQLVQSTPTKISLFFISPRTSGNLTSNFAI